MNFDEVLVQVLAQLERDKRIAYRMLKRRFQLNDDDLEDLKAELIMARRVARDEEGEVLVWAGDTPRAQPPASYTPPHLAERILAEQAAMEARGATDGERKIITIVFADLKGSTALIEGLDPEAASAIIDPALQIMMDASHRYDGYVAQVLGDGIFALFGAPIAHEDHPQRALYAALRMQEDMGRYADRLRLSGGAPLQMRVGVNTGEVVVRSIRKEDLHTDYVPVGHSINLAARMEQMAMPGSILATAHTHKLAAGYFAFKPLGAATIKGMEEPINVFEVLGAGPLRTPLQVATQRGLTRFVGRLDEQAQLRRALEEAKAGHGQLVGVIGEPGVGKSRLLHEFKLTSQSGCLVLEAFSVSHGKASPYLPLIELLKNYLRIQPQDEEQQRRAKIIGQVLALDQSLEDTLPYFFTLLGIEDPAAALQRMDPQIRRRRTFDALKRLLVRESLKQPLLLIFEDLHWLDTETQGFLDLLSESLASAHILLLVNYRPEYRHEWGQKTYYTQLRLTPLGKEEARELLSFLLGNDANLKPLQQLILDKTEGTPFFMEEVVQTLAEEQVLVGEKGAYRLAKAPTELHISPTVQGVLAARIDRLAAAEKELLQQLAVMGREFSLSLVRPVVVQPEEELERLLSTLQAKEFLYEQLTFPEVEYTFKHALTQEVAYSSLLLERRKALHERTAQAIEALYHSRLEDHYGTLAHHYSHSGNTEKAVEYLQLAGQQAMQRSANAEAVNHLTTALGLLQTLPHTPEHVRQELDLQISLGVSLFATQGLASSQAERAYLRAQELCEQLGATLELLEVLVGLGTCYQQQGRLHAAHALGEQGLNLARSLQDPALLLEAHAALGMYSFFLGDLAQAWEHLEQGISLYNSQLHGGLPRFHSWNDPGALCSGFAAKTLRLLGYPDQALRRSREALTLAHEQSHPHSMAFALYVAGVLHHFRREGQVTKERAAAALALAHEQGFPLWSAWGTILGGCALTELGQATEGVAQIRAGLADFRATGSGLLLPYCLALLAEAYGKAGQAEGGLAALAEALDRVKKTGERFYEAELYRLQGELLLWQEGTRLQPAGLGEKTERVEECFHKAIEIARRQQAKSLELRATLSLARLWQRQGKQQEAHASLSEIYNWFTEGFDTRDLQEAKALLQELI